MNKAVYRAMRALFLAAAVVGGGLAVSTAVHAQASTEPAQAGAEAQGATDELGGLEVLEEIVVTARRRKEAIQDVPIAITAFSNDALREQNITSNQDLQGKVPSLNVGANGLMRSTESFTLRGQGATYQAAQGVVMYMAETPLITTVIGTQGGPGAMLDLENLQVLKGPQGTLFGRNTTGGAVLVEPARPTNEFGHYMQAQFGNYQDKEFEAVVNIPIIKDKLLTRIAGRIVDRDGFTENIATGESLDDKKYWTGRIGITFIPTDHVENYLMMFNTNEKDHGTGEVGLAVNSGRALDQTGIAFDPNQIYANFDPAFLGNACDGFDYLNHTTGCGQSLVADQKRLGVRKVNGPVDPFNKFKTYGAVDIFKWDVSDTLTFRNIASYSVVKQAFSWEEDGFPIHFVDGVNNSDQNSTNAQQWTEEVQLQGKLLDRHLDYTVGGYTEHYWPRGTMIQDAIQLPADPAAIDALYGPGTGDLFAPNGAFIRNLVENGFERRSTAAYAQGTYDLGQLTPALDNLKVTAGYRYTWDITAGFADSKLEIPFFGVPFSPFCANGAPFPDCRISAKDRSSAANWLFGLDYKVTQDTLAYFKISKGYKAGGFNGSSVNTTTKTFDPEFNKTYEVGVKSDFHIAEMPTRVNLAVYHSDYTNIQNGAADVNVNGAVGAAIFNIASATIEGVELETNIRPVKGLELAVSYAFTDGDYDDFTRELASPALDCSGTVQPAGGTANLKCTPFPYISRHAWTGSARYRLPLPDTVGAVEVSGSYSHWTSVSQLAGPLIEEPLGIVGGAALANFAIDWRNMAHSPVDLHVFVTNAFDKEYRTSNSGVFPSLWEANGVYGEPRMYGAQVRYRFGGFAGD